MEWLKNNIGESAISNIGCLAIPFLFIWISTYKVSIQKRNDYFGCTNKFVTVTISYNEDGEIMNLIIRTKKDRRYMDGKGEG